MRTSPRHKLNARSESHVHMSMSNLSQAKSRSDTGRVLVLADPTAGLHGRAVHAAAGAHAHGVGPAITWPQHIMPVAIDLSNMGGQLCWMDILRDVCQAL